MSAKNDLQEYFQKRRMALPIYSSTRAGGEDHLPNWVGQVTIADGRTFMSSPHVSKKSAELEAAQIAFKEVLKSGTPAESHEYTLEFTDHQVVVLIDIENQPAALGELVERVKSTGITFYAFLSKGHPLGRKISEADYASDERVCIINVPSTRNDGADVGMMIVVGMMMETSKFTSYLIVSNDHFAEAAADVVRNHHKMYEHAKVKKRFKAAACRDWRDAIDKLQILQSKNKLEY